MQGGKRNILTYWDGGKVPPLRGDVAKSVNFQ